MEMQSNQQHSGWAKPAEFILSLLGYVVGAGNLWRFSSLCFKNGGGAFLIPYVISTCFITLPLYMFEVGLGQFTQKGRVAAMERLPIMKGIGYATVFISVLGMIPFMWTMSWGILYLGHSFTTGPLPWGTCDNEWNTESCRVGVNITNRTVFLQDSLPQVQFWRNYVLRLSNGNPYNENFNWQMLLCSLASFITIYGCIAKGVKTSGKVVYFTATFPYVILCVLFVRGATLEGASNGMRKLFVPDFERLLSPQVWVEAASQALYTVGVCYSGLTAFGSFNRRRNNFYKQAIFVIPAGCLTSIFMGLITFSFLGHIAHVNKVDLTNVISSGPGLVFQVYPYGLSLLPIPQLWSVLFFFMFYLICIDSAFGEFEGLMVVIGDAFPISVSNTKNRLLTGAALTASLYFSCFMFLNQKSLYIFELVNSYGGAGICLLWLALWESISVGWFWNADKFAIDFKYMTGSTPSIYYKYCYKFVIPAATTAILIFYCIKWEPLKVGEYVYPWWANGIGWMLSLSSILWIPGVACYVMVNGKGSLSKRFKQGIKWGFEQSYEGEVKVENEIQKLKAQSDV
nr:sodium- and chloride-dependent GABA transporter 3-like isoform X5 [Ciona intestinalis]|eukprot:XP_002132068.3 sodium- and chloride-dependent GABA transporter 3-like isoform X5 [Ciona intestinalis]